MRGRTEYLAMTPALRARLEETVEHLLGLLDAIDGDPDLEGGCDDEDGHDAEAVA